MDTHTALQHVDNAIQLQPTPAKSDPHGLPPPTTLRDLPAWCPAEFISTSGRRVDLYGEQHAGRYSRKRTRGREVATSHHSLLPVHNWCNHYCTGYTAATGINHTPYHEYGTVICRGHARCAVACRWASVAPQEHLTPAHTCPTAHPRSTSLWEPLVDHTGPMQSLTVHMHKQLYQ